MAWFGLTCGHIQGSKNNNTIIIIHDFSYNYYILFYLEFIIIVLFFLLHGIWPHDRQNHVRAYCVIKLHSYTKVHLFKVVYSVDCCNKLCISSKFVGLFYYTFLGKFSFGL